MRANSSPDAAITFDRIEREHLAEDPGWLALLHYHRDLFTGRWKSQADRPEFFFSPGGSADPHAELIASVQAFLGTNGSTDPRCRLPARYLWLQQHLALQPGFDVLEQCPELAAWFKGLMADHVYIDFASAYLENPSSMFGHTFLRFTTPGTPALLDPTINYAADSSERSGALDFIFRGLFGGFPGLADQLPFYRRLRVYSNNEGRDIWEYPLRLSPDQIRLLLLHLWEIRYHTFDYYFLDENCSYRTLALIAVARPDLDLMATFHGDVVPVETIKLLRDRGLAGDPMYWPSSPKQLLWMTRDLDHQELREVIDLAQGRRNPDALEGAATARQSLILAAASDYLSIRINRDEEDPQTRDPIMQALIRRRLEFQPVAAQDPPPTPPPPEVGHSGHTVSIAAFDRQGQSGAQIGYEGFQHHFTDPLAGYERGASVTVLGGHLRIADDGSSQLEDIDVLDVKSEIPSTQLFQQPVWSMHLGAERKDLRFDRPLIGTLGATAGPAIDTPLGVLAGTAGVDVDFAPELRGDAALEAGFGLHLTRQARLFSYETFFQKSRYVVGDDSLRHEYGARIGVPIAQNLGATLSWQRDGSAVTQSEALFSINWFF